MVTKGAWIGKGMTAEVYEWGTDKVIKLYYEGVPLDWIRLEAEIGLAVEAAGVPAPRVHGMAAAEGRHGLLYDKIAGSPMLDLIRRSAVRMTANARAMARLHGAVHRCSSAALPRQKDRLEQAIGDARGILGGNAAAICAYLRALPDGDRVCHGDFHPGNIIAAGDRLTAIDWTNACTGDPAGDAARTSLMFLSPFLPPGTTAAMTIPLRIAKRVLNRAYLKEYCRLSAVSEADIGAWMLPVAAARLRENIPGERDWLLSLIDRRLAALAPHR